MKNFYVTSPIFYPNAQPHMGHAYTTLLCDVLARYHKSIGEETYFLTGTDEHTEKIIQAAKTQGQEPTAYLETIVERFKNLYKKLDIAYDQFIRTSDQHVHWPGAIEMWKRLSAAGKLEKREYTGLYCSGCEAFKTEKELINGLCPDHGTAPEKVTEQNWFFKLKEFGPQLEQLITNDELCIIPQSRKKEILSFIRSGLEDVSFSRPKDKMTRGIPVPEDPTQTMYIWVDALTNYITALGFGRGEELMRFWPGIHIIGKDILRFHTVFWPAMLLSAKLSLPKAVFVHGTIISNGKKMSKSLGNIISPYDMIDRYGKDGTRYLLLRHIHPFEDTDVTWERLDEWYTADLVSGLGNWVARVMQMASLHLDAPVDLSDRRAPYSVAQWMDKFEFHNAIAALWIDAAHIDGIVQEQKPFEVVKTNKKQAQLQLTYLVKELSRLSESLESFMPETAEKIKKAIRENKKPENLFPRLID